MKIDLAKTAGFCFGVNKAMEQVSQLLDENKSVYTLGPLIHNPQVVSSLEVRGAHIVDSPDEVPNGAYLVIRSHGVPKQVLDDAQNRDINVCNATCPFVEKIHKIVEKDSENGAVILIAGDEKHPEVEGIRGYCLTRSYVFESCEGLKKILLSGELDLNASITLVSQTTFQKSIWEDSKKIIKQYCTKIAIYDTICNATASRQEEAIRLSQSHDIMVIVGGRQSSNTAKLKDVCSENCPTYLVETAAELSANWFRGVRSVGLTAGASTPADIIKEVLETMADEVNNVIENGEEGFAELLEQYDVELNENGYVRGIVTNIFPSEVEVEVVGRKQTGYIPIDELSVQPVSDPGEIVKVGDELDLLIMRTNDQEGTIKLSKKKVDAHKGWDDLVAAHQAGEILEGVVSQTVHGGILVATETATVFIPASQASSVRIEDQSVLIGNKVRFVLIDMDERRRRAVGSIRKVANEERKEKAQALWESIEVGQVFTGVVKSLTNYGAFVDLGGVDGMIHVSELSWTHIKNPADVLSVGQTVEVYVRKLDAEKHKISLGYRKEEDNPWVIFNSKYSEGDVVDAKIVSMTTFGAFASIIPGVDGLIHISQISNHRVEKPQDELKIGQEVQVKITKIDDEQKRISLSIRALLPVEEKVEEAAEEVTEEVTEEVVEEVKEEAAVVEEETTEEA